MQTILPLPTYIELKEVDSSSNSSSSLTCRPAVMSTTLPLPKDINLKDVDRFDGTFANLSLFDTNIRNALEHSDIPVYYGGCVTGNAVDGFDFVPATTEGCQSNYKLGRKLCSGISVKFVGAAAQWWDSYDTKAENPKPNCWKKAMNARFIPEGVVEVSLYDLLVMQFDSAVDVRQAELELEGYRWDPLDEKALEFVPFHGHVDHLCARAGKTRWNLKGNAIRNTLPDWLKKKVDVTTTEEAFWMDVAKGVNTEVMNRAGRICSLCQKQGHTANECRKSRENRADSDGDGVKEKCLFCHFDGHDVSNCRKMKAAQRRLANRPLNPQQAERELEGY